ncbi:hypothetical protein [Mesorhizobium sp. SP-1A]|uniref:hypothetical protein n=1 Tax=Mesorhizobium sp. SP-1A TaxID=3077840 RepID=UPI0028F6C61E|nr:hypothetical protein [Mesorhizobium sp. SP-1A]
MTDNDALAALAGAIEAREAEPPLAETGTVAMHPQRFVSALVAGGEFEIAAKAANAVRLAGRSANIPANVEAIATRQRAEAGAETFRRINKTNATNHPLPAWIRSELGVTY